MSLRTAILAVLAPLVFGAPLLLANAETTSTDPIAEDQDLPRFYRAPAEEISARDLALRTRLEREQQELTALAARLAKTADPQLRQELFHEIGRVKRQAEGDLLEIQLEYARNDGHHELAERLDAGLKRLEATKSAQPAEGIDPTARTH